MALKTRMETTTCPRCGGSGSYSYNQIHGSMCYGCNGKGANYTKRANVALDMFRKLREQPLESFTVGDLVRYTPSLGRERTVQIASEPVETKSGRLGNHPDGTTNYDDISYYHGVTLSWGNPENRKGEQRLFMLHTPPVFGAIVGDELHAHAVELMIEYQNLLTKQGGIRKDSTERAAAVETEIAEIFSNPSNRINKPVVIPAQQAAQVAAE